MRIVEENWEMLASLIPAGWQQMAWQSGAVERLRGFPSPEVMKKMEAKSLPELVRMADKLKSIT
jgi:FixJ family two-component response regulator